MSDWIGDSQLWGTSFGVLGSAEERLWAARPKPLFGSTDLPGSSIVYFMSSMHVCVSVHFYVIKHIPE